MSEGFTNAEFLPIHTKKARWEKVTVKDVAVQLIKILEKKLPTFENISIIARCKSIVKPKI